MRNRSVSLASDYIVEFATWISVPCITELMGQNITHAVLLLLEKVIPWP